MKFFIFLFDKIKKVNYVIAQFNNIEEVFDFFVDNFNYCPVNYVIESKDYKYFVREIYDE